MTSHCAGVRASKAQDTIQQHCWHVTHNAHAPVVGQCCNYSRPQFHAPSLPEPLRLLRCMHSCNLCICDSPVPSMATVGTGERVGQLRQRSLRRRTCHVARQQRLHRVHDGLRACMKAFINRWYIHSFHTIHKMSVLIPLPSRSGQRQTRFLVPCCRNACRRLHVCGSFVISFLSGIRRAAAAATSRAHLRLGVDLDVDCIADLTIPEDCHPQRLGDEIHAEAVRPHLTHLITGEARDMKGAKGEPTSGQLRMQFDGITGSGRAS